MSRFSQLYVERPTGLLNDSRRFRIRLGAWVENFQFATELGRSVVRLLQGELGIEIQYSRTFEQTVAQVLAEASVADVLDAITLIDRALLKFESRVSGGSQWRAFVQRAFVEENLCYRLGSDGIVHPFIDEEFEHNRSSVLLALSDDRFAEARSDYEAAFRHFRNSEGKQAIRMMFPAVEVAAKILHPGAMSRFMPTEVERFLLSQVQRRYSGNLPALEAGKHVLIGFKEWIIASQQYRHGQEIQEPQEPPVDFLAAYLSIGASYLRWMIDLCE